MTRWIDTAALTICIVLSTVLKVPAMDDMQALDFGLKADGKTDDGPVILRMIEAARAREGKPVRLVFPQGKVIHAATGKGRYLFPLQHTKNLTIDGGGSTFLLDPHIRMVDLDYAQNPVLRNLNVDYTVTMFIESVIEAVDPKRRYVDVRVLEPGEAKHLGGPTKEDGEQWFGGFVWCENGKNPKAARHYSVKSAEQLGDGRARIFYGGKSISKRDTDRIKPGHTRFSLPRPGVAHRHGPGPMFNIHDTVDGHFENIAIWGAPWFAFSVYRTEGTCRFINVDLVPKPGTNRLMTVCRDAFHVTGNRAKLIFDGCDTAGLGDDDYNFCILSATIREIVSPTELVICQKFPIQYNPMRVGETLMVMNRENTVIGSARIASYDETPQKDGSPTIPGGRYCPKVTITLETPIDGLQKDLTVWSKEAANPDTTMRNCTASFSIRMQTSINVDHCKLSCYNVAYGLSPRHRNVEGPGPEYVRITNSEFHAGRGSGMVVQSGGKGPLETCRVRDVHIENSVFHTRVNIAKAESITLLQNRFESDVSVGKHRTLTMSGNLRKGEPFTLPGAGEPRKPNILLILSDDQGYCELGSFLKFAEPDNLQPLRKDVLSEMLASNGGREAVQVCFDAVKKATPNLDGIAGQGMRFTNFYAAPTCGPSRAALMSARYPQTFGAYSNTELSDGAGVPPSVGFPVQAFADAGYRTGVFGKWHLGREEGQHPNDKGFDTYFGYDRAHTDKYDSPHLYRNKTKAKAEGWLCDQMTGEALGFLEQCHTEKKPFFMFFSLCEPKPPSPAPPQKYMDAISSGSSVVDSHFGSIYGMDVNVGRLLAKIKAMSAEHDTMILFASDNGLNNGVWREQPDYRKKNGQEPKKHPAWPRVPIPGNGPLRGAKWCAWEGGVRTPMFAYVPDGRSGESNALQHIMDLMPTALDYAGIKADLPLDGKSFLPQLTGTSEGDPGRTLFWAHLDAIPMAFDGHPELQGVEEEFKSVKKRKQIDYFASWYARSGKWKLVGWNDAAPLLFDISEDWGEHRNVAAQYPEVVSELRRAFLDWMKTNKEPYVGKKEIWQRMLE